MDATPARPNGRDPLIAAALKDVEREYGHAISKHAWLLRPEGTLEAWLPLGGQVAHGIQPCHGVPRNSRVRPTLTLDADGLRPKQPRRIPKFVQMPGVMASQGGPA